MTLCYNLPVEHPFYPGCW